jgi:nitrite reductase (NADH) small subunit
MSNWYKITEVANIPEMGARVIEFGKLELAIFKTKDGEIFAINNICPHKQGKLNDGLVHEHIVTCPLHNTDINLENGSAIGENYECSKTYETKIENQLIYIQIP